MIQRTEILGERYSYRLLTRRELREALESSPDDPLEFEENICRACITEVPDDFPGYTDCLAGIPTTLCNEIMAASGYTSDQSAFEQEALTWAQTPQARMDVLICFCFPKWSIDDLESMDPHTYYKYAAASQLIIGGVYGMDASTFLDPSRDGQPAPPRGPAPPPPQRQQSPYLIQ